MPRVRLNPELISNEKSRHTTFQKRMKGLMKKTFEFSKLCDVDACLIVYGPKHGDRPVKPEIWPQNSDQVLRIINRYKDHSKEEREKQNLSLSNFFQDRKKKAEDELSKLRQMNDDSNYSLQSWDDHMNFFDQDQLREHAVALESKLEDLKNKIGSIKGKQGLMEIPCVFQRSMGLDDMLQQQQQQQPPVSRVKPSDHRFPNDYPYNQTLMFNASSIAAPMIMNNVDYTQFSGGSCSNLHYPPPLQSQVHYNSTFGTLEEMEFSHPGPSTCYYPSQFIEFPDFQM